MSDKAKLRELVRAGEAGLTPELVSNLPLPPDEARRLRAQERGETEKEFYVISDALVSAIQVSLLLRQPLLLTGEPGIGKTRLAFKLAETLGLPKPNVKIVKSVTTGQDLLYSFDDVRRFRDAAAGARAAGVNGEAAGLKPLRDYIHFEALGQAILAAADPDAEVEPSMPLLEILGYDTAPDQKITLRDIFPNEIKRIDKAFAGTQSRISVVLIDEIDKASRDTPNDLLDEIDRMRFSIRELGLTISATAKLRPIVIITSNSERSLPDPFLRRCVFHHLQLDDTDKTASGLMGQMVLAKLPEIGGGLLLEDILKLFSDVRALRGLEKVPSIAELVATVAYLSEIGFEPHQKLHSDLDRFHRLVPAIASILAKKREDVDNVIRFLKAGA